MIQTKEVPLDSLTLREEFKRDASYADRHIDLVQSIKARGILYPLITMETPEGLLLVAGYRRYAAAKELDLATVPCICLKVGLDDAEILRLHENLYREDITPIAEAEAMHRLETTYHFTRSKIANLLGKSASYVTQRLQILSWHTRLKEALRLDHINYSVARELSSVSDEEQLRFMIDQIITSGASVRVVATWVQELKTSTPSPGAETKSSPPLAEPKPTSEEPTACYFCAQYLPVEQLTQIPVCPGCLDNIKPTEE